MTNEQKFQIVCLALIFFIILLIILCIIYVSLMVKRKKEEAKKKAKKDAILKSKFPNANNGTEHTKIYTTRPVEEFMQFDKIQDNMIIKKEGLKYLMVIECKGVNYDLMSAVEKTSVEEGFLQFLNTLRHPIQIYVQTRTINLESSLQTYRNKISEIEKQLKNKEEDFKVKKESGKYSTEELNQMFYDITKQRNLYEYGKDIVRNTEMMSQNKNVLNKQYYVVVPYYATELVANNNYDKNEINNIAFSELYTRSQAIIRTLSGCGVVGRILDSNSLVDLLYVAYNRDDSEVFDLRKALAAEYDEVYSTAPDVLDKKIVLLNKKIEEEAYKKANEAISEVKNEKEEKINDTEKNYDNLIDELATMILEKNKTFIGENTADLAIDKIKNQKNNDEDNNNEEENRNVEHKKKRKLPEDKEERERILRMRKRKKMRELQKMREGM